jgi:hypothetical protein
MICSRIVAMANCMRPNPQAPPAMANCFLRV